jgi:Xaa-Pro aminopeptidase
MSYILSLKKLLQQNDIYGYLIPIRDEFGCEYVPESAKRLQFITGFTGSNGFAIITKQNNAFFTDGRYTLQAKLEIDKNDFEIYDLANICEIQWLYKNTPERSNIGYDASLFSIAKIEKYKAKLQEKNIKLVEIEKNLIDEVWKNKPKPSQTKAIKLDKKYSGKSSKIKIKEICEKINGDFYLQTSSESICWLLNIRGNDLPYTPVLLTYALISKKGEIYLYGNLNALNKIENDIEADVYLRDLKDIYKDIKSLSGKKIATDCSLTSIKFKNILEKNKAQLTHQSDICLEGRAIKNWVEIENIKHAHIKDGAALTKFLYWLKTTKDKLSEISIADKLEEFRKQNENFFSLSFDTIAGFNSNGAIIHYRADKKSNKKINGNGILLLDSGAQYLQGTTDITRTISIGKPTPEQKKNFTLVLKGHIALASQKFLNGTSGAQLDILARQFLWAEGLDYKHGTGHGVGCFLNVHEGPHAISRINHTPLQEGMIISNEPGYYKEGEYGIRIENLVLVKKSEQKDFLEFETLTKAPIDISLIDFSLLDKNEIKWLNDYHKQVIKDVSPYLNKQELAWLTKSIKVSK